MATDEESPPQSVDDELADDLVIDFGVGIAADNEMNICDRELSYRSQTNRVDKYHCHHQSADMVENSMPQCGASDNTSSVSPRNGRVVEPAVRCCRHAEINGHEIPRFQNKSTVSGHAHNNSELKVNGFLQRRSTDAIDEYPDTVAHSLHAVANQLSVNGLDWDRLKEPERYNREPEDHPGLKKIERDFDKLLETVQSAAKREIIMNKFIIFLMTKRNSSLETLAMMEDVAGKDMRKSYSPSQTSHGAVDSHFNHPSINTPAEWGPGHVSQTSSQTSDAAAVLNLSVPRRRSSTPRVDQNVVVEHCSSCKCGSSAAPRPAHHHESGSPRPAERTTSGTSQSHVSSWPPAPSSGPCDGYSWSGSEVKEERADVVTVNDDDDDDGGSFGSTMRHGTGARAVRVGQPRTSKPVVLCRSARAVQSSALDNHSALSLKMLEASPAYCHQPQQSTVAVTKPDAGVRDAAYSQIDSPRTALATQNLESLMPDSNLMRSFEERYNVSSPPKKVKVKKGRSEDSEKEHIKRPMNSFMCWAHSERAQLSKVFPNKNNADISRMLGERWRKMTPEEKKPYEEQSIKHSEQLLEKHPDYRYRPRRKEKGRIGESRLQMQKLPRSPDVDSSQYGVPVESCYGAIAGLMSLNRGWVGVPTASGHTLRDIDAAAAAAAGD